MHIRKRAAVVTVGAAALLAAAGGVAVATGDGEPDDLTRAGTVAVDESALPEDDAAEQRALAELASVDEATATAAAVRALGGGEAVAAELEEEDGFVVWEVDVRGAAGAWSEVTVDAGDAGVLATETEDDEEDDGADGD
ncbi:hypothetical protein [Geodermatophilus sp. SYSU D00079]